MPIANMTKPMERLESIEQTWANIKNAIGGPIKSEITNAISTIKENLEAQVDIALKVVKEEVVRFTTMSTKFKEQNYPLGVVSMRDNYIGLQKALQEYVSD